MKKIKWLISCTALVLALGSMAPVEAATHGFRDVSANHSNYKAIQAMQSAGYITGYPDNTYRPGENIKRKHVTKLLDKALKLPELEGNEAAYRDVPKGHAYYAPIMKLTKAGIFSGGLDGKFNPEAPMTRIQMAKVLDFAFGFNMTVYAAFDDVGRGHWGYVHANALYASGVAKGDRGKFYPNRPVTRGHYAEFLHRALAASAGKPGTDRMTRNKAQDLTSRLTHSIEMAMIQGQSKKRTFAQIRPTLLDYATENFTDTVLKRYYPYVCTDCDTFFFPFEPRMEYKLRFDYSQPDGDMMKVNTVEFADGLVDAAFINYQFKNESGRWKLAKFDNIPIGKEHFKLTAEEAKQILVEDYKVRTGLESAARYVSKKTQTGHDIITNDPYSYELYTFDLVVGKEKTRVTFNSASGMYQ